MSVFYSHCARGVLAGCAKLPRIIPAMMWLTIGIVDLAQRLAGRALARTCYGSMENVYCIGVRETHALSSCCRLPIGTQNKLLCNICRVKIQTCCVGARGCIRMTSNCFAPGHFSFQALGLDRRDARFIPANCVRSR